MTEFQKMSQGLPYDAMDPELVGLRRRARSLCWRLTTTDPGDERAVAAIIGELLPNVKKAYITPPFFCDYGINIFADNWFYCNAGCVFLDPAIIRIGGGTLFGPNAQIYTATHPVHPEKRRSGVEFAKSVFIGINAWIGGSSILCPGVSVGENTVIGAGSVVTRDLPPNVTAAGNPCRIIKYIGEDPEDG